MNKSSSLSWSEYLRNLPDDLRYLFTFTKIHNYGKDIAYAIRTKTAIAVADASVELKTGYAVIAWIISDRQESFEAFGYSGCPRFLNALDSYGSESFGLLVMLTVIKVVYNYYHIKNGKVTIGCDNDSSLAESIQSEYRAKIGDKYFDLLWSIFYYREGLPITIVAHNVMGHQDNKKKKLNIYERLNVRCDTRSNHFRRQLDIFGRQPLVRYTRSTST